MKHFFLLIIFFTTLGCCFDNKPLMHYNGIVTNKITETHLLKPDEYKINVSMNGYDKIFSIINSDIALNINVGDSLSITLDPNYTDWWEISKNDQIKIIKR